jgi:hydroxymethylbilane synthase
MSTDRENIRSSSAAKPGVVLRLGTRGSMLARMQSQMIADDLQALHPGLRVELKIIGTTGDRIDNKPLHDIGGKGLFTRELELALLEGSIDFAVHSLKDVPVTMPLVDTAELIIAATPLRADPRDLLVSAKAARLGDLPSGAIVGTGSLRRRCQILHRRPDLNVQSVRGNVDTRLRHLKSGKFDAVILAEAGVRRCGLYDASLMHPIDVDEMLPAAGQGALALQCTRASLQTRELLAGLNDLKTSICVNAERAVIWALNGDCHSPIAAFAQIVNDVLTLRAAVGQRDGKSVLSARATAPPEHSSAAVDRLTADLLHRGAAELLASAASDAANSAVEVC